MKYPTAVKHYNESMGGDDKGDMLRVLYGVNRKSVKWWHQIFWGVLDIASVNADIAYQTVTGNIALHEFRRKVAQGL